MKTKILVIEDDTAISELICMNLEAAGYDPVPIYDGEEAETAVLAEKEKREGVPEYALALLDIMLPGKDGFQLMEVMQTAEIPVIYLTAKADVVSKVHGLRAGAEDYIVKPFEVLELLVRIEKVLQRTGARQGNNRNTGCAHRPERASGDEGRKAGGAQTHGI